MNFHTLTTNLWLCFALPSFTRPAWALIVLCFLCNQLNCSIKIDGMNQSICLQDSLYYVASYQGTVRSICAYQDAISKNMAVGKIEYTAYDYTIKNPAIYLLWVAPEWRKKGIASELLTLALNNLKTSKKNMHVHVWANPTVALIETSAKSDKSTLSLEELILFYKKRGAVLISKQPSLAHLKFKI